MKLKTTIDIIWYWLLYHFCSGDKRQHYKDKYINLNNKNNILFNRILAYKYIKKHGKTAYFVIGDSHTEIFHSNNYKDKKKIFGDEHNETQIWFNHSRNFICYHLDAVTAYNSINANATIPTIKKVKFLIKNGYLPKGCKIICSFGEIDCRVHIQKQSEKQNRSIENIIDDVIDNYLEFLLILKNMGYDVTAYGPIPSQSDNYPVDEKFPRYGNQKQRNKITKIFNKKLEAQCNLNNVRFKTLFYTLINEDMTTKEEYISYKDHVHLGCQTFHLVKKLFCESNNENLAANLIPFNKIPLDKKDIYVLTYHSGEVFVFLELLRSAVNYGEICQNSLLIATKKYHIDLIEMICPEIDYRYVPKAHSLIECIEKYIICNNKNVRIIFTQFFADSCHILWLNRNNNIHYFDKIKEYINFDLENSQSPILNFDKYTKNNVEEKIIKYHLGEKFVFIAPEALTCKPISIEFWESLYEVLSSQGYDVFWNITKDQQLFNFGKSFDLSIKEANYLARRASGIISLRSGLSEQLAIIQNIPNIILYTETWDYGDVPPIDSERMKQILSLKKYPFTSDNIYEFVLQNSNKDLINNIVKIITKN